MSRVIRRTPRQAIVLATAAIIALGLGTGCATADPAPAPPSGSSQTAAPEVDMNTVVAQYLEAWNATDPATRKAAIARVFTEQATYVDPLMAVTGHAEIDGGIAAVQAKFPGWVFKLAGPVDAHHNQVRFTWGLGPAGSEPVVIGFDVAVVENGRIAKVYGFLDKVPAA
ncbi:nuclear transport factor 2 family protein [Nocardia suismassiliense]|uniref:Nuclear transport factor 2 family protein n=1 Tax=Nocardia suismassiliense TaxID=2077092 RepID=A0ABW6R555_9NOCA